MAAARTRVQLNEAAFPERHIATTQWDLDHALRSSCQQVPSGQRGQQNDVTKTKDGRKDGADW